MGYSKNGLEGGSELVVDETVMAVSDRVSQLLKRCESLVSDVEGRDLGTFPEFRDVQRRSVLYEEYGNASKTSYDVGLNLSELYLVRDLLRKLNTSLKRDRESPRSLREPVINQVEEFIVRVDAMIDSIKALKDSVDTMVRFYSSVQYILGSPRLEGMS